MLLLTYSNRAEPAFERSGLGQIKLHLSLHISLHQKRENLSLQLSLDPFIPFVDLTVTYR